MSYAADDQLLPVRREPKNFWERTGLTERQEHTLNGALVALVALFLAGWVYSAVAAFRRGEAPQIARSIANAPTPLSPGAAPSAAFVLDAALRTLASNGDFRGESGAVRVVVQGPGDSTALPDSLPQGVQFGYQPVGGDTTAAAPTAGRQPPQPGVWNVLLRMRDAVRSVPNLTVVSLVPRSQIRSGRLGSYRMGSWPEKDGIYTPPRGFVQVTPENMDTYVSEHIQLKDFLTKGQQGVWPKYVAMSPLLLDKLELTFQELEKEGHPVKNVFAVSGFRTPTYNESGGDPSGRASLSRHMYGDAMDIAIDNDGDGRMDDLNGDGRVDVKDALVVGEAAQRVERQHPNLVGGIGIYRPTGAHSGFVHIDTRGYRARWGAW